MTYTALASLLILGDDLSRVHRSAIIEGLKSLQNPDGRSATHIQSPTHHNTFELVMFIGCSFCPMAYGDENDVRFIYCACCISFMLNDWSGINQDKAVDFIRKSQVIY